MTPMTTPVTPIAPSSAVRAYAAASAPTNAPNFGATIDAMVTQGISAIRRSEVVQARAMTGNADIQQVVQAITAADLAVNQIVAVRDRLVGAYQEVLRMAV